MCSLCWKSVHVCPHLLHHQPLLTYPRLTLRLSREALPCRAIAMTIMGMTVGFMVCPLHFRLELSPPPPFTHRLLTLPPFSLVLSTSKVSSHLETVASSPSALLRHMASVPTTSPSLVILPSLLAALSPWTTPTFNSSA